MPPRTTDDRAHPAPGLMAGRTTAPPLMHVPALLVGAGAGLTRARPVGGLAVRMLGCGVLVAACLLVLFAGDTGHEQHYNSARGAVRIAVGAAASPSGSQDCDSERWLFVVATGRSGSTSLLTMLNELPGVYLAGENDGVIPSLYRLHRQAVETQYTPRDGPWQHRAIDKTQLRTVARQYVKAAIGMDPLQRYSMIGFKEIRYDSIEQLEYLFQLFPCSKAVVDYRLDIQAQDASRAALWPMMSSARLREQTDMYLDWARRHPTRIRTVALEELSLQSMDALAAWLGFERCHYTCLNHANHNGTYAPDPLRCLRCVPTL